MNFGLRAVRRRGWISAAALATAGALSFLPGSAQAQQNCGSSFTQPPTHSWSAPLDRIIAVRARNVALRDGLDRIAAAARFRLSYSAELLPLDRRVCLSVDSISAGDALAQMLSGTNVDPVVASADQIVLAPVSPAAVISATALAESVQTLERVVVTGSATGDAQRPLSVALDVLDGVKLADRSSASFSSSFDENIPGVWVWEQAPSSLLARYGSIRGASSFGLSYPKVYIDGIEVANPLLVTDINPAVLDHVEVIRGPQGAALYGADAISGVVNIVTRHEGTQAGADRTEITSGAGFSQSGYAPTSVFTQSHGLTWRGGSSMRSGSLAISGTTLGGYVPEAYSRDLNMNGALRLVTSAASFTGTARFYDKQAATGENPLLRGFTQSVASRGVMPNGDRSSRAAATLPDSAELITQDSLPESMHEYTFGGAANFLTGGRWTPSIVAGIDGYRLANVPNDLAPVSSATDTALHAARGGADRGTLRASLVGSYDLTRQESLTITLAAEHSALRETQQGGPLLNPLGQPLPGNPIGPDVISWRSNSGLIAQGNLAAYNSLYLTGGLRLERNDGFTTTSEVALLPMIGAAVVHDVGIATLKLRGAYGRGIRPAITPMAELMMRDMHRAPQLDPEQQAGTEFGADLMIGRRLGLHVTRFDQTAFGLIQPVAIPHDSVYGNGTAGPGGAGYQSGNRPRMSYVLQNVGQIGNHGWEFESSTTFGALSVGGGLSLVDSRVQRIARYYTGDLLPGDRMLAVPAQTSNLSMTWTQPRWYATVSGSRASDWINYDRLRLAQDFTSGNFTSLDMTGSRLRSYWTQYNGVTRLRATVSRDLLDNVSLHVTGDNLTNVQRGEPDNITVLPGRTVLFGLSARIR